MMNERTERDQLTARIEDLKEKSERWHRTVSSSFLNEEETAAVSAVFPASDRVIYDGGYPEARKKKVIFRYDPEDDFSDIVCLKAEIDQRFRKIGHRDILGALMHLQIERSSFGDFWIDDDTIYLYTSEDMAGFLIDNLIRINQLSVSFERTDDHPSQVFKTRTFQAVIASERLDAVVAGIAHCSRSEAKAMIRQGLVMVNHVVLEEPDELCNNNVTISLRGIGRFEFAGVLRKTKSGRLTAEFRQYM